jgi:hypothetical protein
MCGERLKLLQLIRRLLPQQIWNQILYSGQPLHYKYVQNGFHSLLWQVIPNFKLKVQDEWTVLQPDQRMGCGG